MLSNAFEWERLIHPNPSEEMVVRRKTIVAEVLSAFDSDKDIGDVLRLASAALTGLSPEIASDVEYGNVLTEVTKKTHQAFPSQLSENALDLQLTACLAIGELLVRKHGKGTWKEPQIAVAGACLSAVGFMPSGGLHLKSIRELLISVARELLARTVNVVRKRPECDLTLLNELSPNGDIAVFWSQLKPALLTALDTIARASAIDHEELEVLWWLYNSESAIFSKKLSEMSAYDVAYAATIELVDRAKCPAPTSLRNIVHGLVAQAANKPPAAGKTLKSVICAWTTDIISELLPKDAKTVDLVANWPKIFPLTWIASKITSAGVTTGWEQEFTSRTGFSATIKITPELLTNQVFAERTAQRLLMPFQGE